MLHIITKQPSNKYICLSNYLYIYIHVVVKKNTENIVRKLSVSDRLLDKLIEESTIDFIYISNLLIYQSRGGFFYSINILLK